MNKIEAKNLITCYIGGWKEGDAQRVLKPLAENCVIIESHGPKFEGKNEIEKWVENWIAKDSKVTKWNIVNFIYECNVASVSWEFECVDEKVSHKISGVSIVRFSDTKIIEILEYMRTQNPYPGINKFTLDPTKAG